MKTLQECKDQVAKKNGYKNFRGMEDNGYGIGTGELLDYMDQAAEIYASQFKGSELGREQMKLKVANMIGRYNSTSKDGLSRVVDEIIIPLQSRIKTLESQAVSQETSEEQRFKKIAENQLLKIKELNAKIEELEGKETFSLRDRSQSIDLLERYSEYLQKEGYIDTDWGFEPPYAIDEFLRLPLAPKEKDHDTR